MITSKIEQHFALFLMSVAECEGYIENERKKLNKISKSIDMYELFKFVDASDLKYIDDNSLMIFFERNKIFYTYQEVKILIKFYDSDRDGKLNYCEFLNIIISNNYELNTNNSLSKKHSTFPINENIIFNQFIKILEGELLLCRKILSSNLDNYFDSIFYNIDKQNKKYFTLDDIKNYFNYNGLLISDGDMKYIFKRLDVNQDGRVTISELNFILKDENILTLNKNKIIYSPKRQFDTDVSSNLKSSSSNKFLEYNKNYNSSTIREDNYSRINNNFNYQFISKDELIFLDFIKEIVEIETYYENLKCSLSLKYDFNLKKLFNLFETECKNFLTLTELKEGFNKFGIFPTSEEANLILKKYDTNKNGVLYFEDFSEMFYPTNKHFIKIISKRSLKNGVANRYDNFSEETKLLIRSYINCLIIGELKIELLRKRLNELRGFSIIDIFNKLDKNDKKYLCEEDVSI